MAAAPLLASAGGRGHHPARSRRVLLILAALGLLRLSPPGMLLALTRCGLLVGWRLRWPDGFLRWLRLPVRAWRRGWLLYRHRWAAAMDTAGRPAIVVAAARHMLSGSEVLDKPLSPSHAVTGYMTGCGRTSAALRRGRRRER